MQVHSLSTLQGGAAPQLVQELQAGLPAARSPGAAENAPNIAPSQAPQPTKQTDAAELKKAVESLNKTVSSLNQSLQFTIDSDTKLDVVKVIDITSREVLRQIPSPEVISIAKAIDKLQGMLIKDKA